MVSFVSPLTGETPMMLTVAQAFEQFMRELEPHAGEEREAQR